MTIRFYGSSYFNPDSIFTDSYITVGKKNYTYSELVSYKHMWKPTIFMDGFFLLTFQTRKIWVPYNKKQKDDAQKLISLLESRLQASTKSNNETTVFKTTQNHITPTNDEFKNEYTISKNHHNDNTESKSNYSDLIELKELLNLNIITQEEFDKKKKEILKL